MEFSFFTTDNKSGYKTTEKWLSKNHPKLYKSIIDYSSNFNFEFSFKEKIWFFYNKLTERPKCLTCNNEVKFRGRFDNPYGEFCSIKCFNENTVEMSKRQMKTFQEKYGVDYYPQHKEFVEKQKKTKKEKYGDENYNNSVKTRLTKKNKYGDENYNNQNKYQTTCLELYGSNNYSSSSYYRKKIIEEYKKLYTNIRFTQVNKQDVTFFCEKCEEESVITKQLLYERYKRGYDVCIQCNPIGHHNKSGKENEISKFLSSLNIEHTCSNKILLNKKELDILISQNKLAIEFNGVYWHNELFVNSTYHLNKTNECKEKNITLLHIFEDEWNYKQEIVKSIIKNKLKINDNTNIFARNTIIKNVNSQIAKKFLNDNHIQGNVNSKVSLGLYYKDELVSLMCFSKGRIIIGGKKNEWELTRFCNLINTNVVGGASKLFNYFVKEYSPEKVVSYSDIRLFDGGLYEKLNFKRISQSKPNYWYVINGIRYHRFNFRKSILVKEGYDKNKTEKEIMFERKYYRIYDCGAIRWEYSLQKN